MSEKYERLGLNSEDVKTCCDLDDILGNINKTFEQVYEISMDTCGIVVEDGKIIGIGLFNCELTKFPEQILKFKSLQKLNIADNKLETIPESISELSNLKKLDLSINKLSSIPESIEKLTFLKNVALEQNQLESIPESIGNLKNLKTLNLSENNLINLPDTIGKLNSLKKLNLKGNQLNCIPESIGELNNIESLILGNNNLSELPWTIWKLKKLSFLHLDNNFWKDEWEELASRDLPSILKFCQQKATINIFLSHAVVDFDYFRIKDISEFLQNQEEIYCAFYCETDLTGNIDDFMNETVPKCQLLLFFASQKSVFNSIDCVHELELARKHSIQIIPIKGKDVNWGDLREHNLDRLLGHKYNESEFNEFCENLYDYIKQFKSDVNLFEPEEAKFDKEKLNIKNVINHYLNSEKFDEILRKNLDHFKEIFQMISNNEISLIEYLEKFAQTLMKK
ncbi:MAG: leucine-rich repeat domain-containing protein [Candidatus Hermodarchaeota archaeon]